MFGKVKVLRTEKKILNESKRKDLQLRLWVKHCQITAEKSFKKKFQSSAKVKFPQIIFSRRILTSVELA